MEAVFKLCTRGLFFETGHIRATGDIKTAVNAYLHNQSSSPRVIDLSSSLRPDQLSERARFAKASPSNTKSSWSIPFGQQLSLDLSIDAQSPLSQIDIFIGIFSARGFEVASWSNSRTDQELELRPGINTFRIKFEEMRLLPGLYSFGMALRCSRGMEDCIPKAISFEVIPNGEAADINAEILGGALFIPATVSVLG